MDYYNKAFQSLQSLLTDENIDKSIENYKSKQEYTEDNPRDRTSWYHESYPLIIATFNNTRGQQQKGRWVARLALTSSWVPTIPTPALEEQAMTELSRLEMKYFNRKLEEINVGEQEEEKYFDIGNAEPIMLKVFLQLADRIVNGGGNWDRSISSTTKVLHFMCPGLFPMFDGNINQIIYGNKSFNYPKYHGYVFALREFLQTSSQTGKIKKLAEKEQLSLIRMTDILLFHME
ncbi:hypothetical protein [Sediminibacillus massiliensis]|uniref:hypothetical protein n=1 Tax=Sediminibacillus massiliensis TaxID=1926277 RepID=UPI000988866C|nr:hypothetical protein [Sediminibacillus massiliensis]